MRPRPFFTISPLLVNSFTILSITPFTNFPELGEENSLAISIYSFKDTFVGINGKYISSAIEVISIIKSILFIYINYYIYKKDYIYIYIYILICLT